MKIIQKSQTVTETNYSLVFDWRDKPGQGFSFPCDKKGHVNTNNLPEAARENYHLCVNGTYNVIPKDIKSYTHTYTIPAVGICTICSRKIVLSDSFLNTCTCCGADYDGTGHLLAPRDQWREETNETVSDIFSPLI